MNILIVYDTKYGATKQIAHLISAGIGEQFCEIKHVNDVNLSTHNCDLILIGSPVYRFRVLPTIERFIEDNKKILQMKYLSFFIVCLIVQSGERCLQELKNYTTGKKHFKSKVFLGRFSPNMLDKPDLETIKMFFPDVQLKLVDMINPQESINFGKEIKNELCQQYRHSSD